MLELLPAPETVVAMRATGRVDEADINRAIEAVEAALARHPRISLLAEIEMSGMTPGALARDLSYGLGKLGDLNRFPRVAVVTGQDWIRGVAWFQNRILPQIELRTFSPAERDEAMAWVSQPLDEPQADREVITPAFLDAFADAWNRHDVDAIVAAMTPDCIMQTSSGPDVGGRRAVGHDEVRRVSKDFFAAMPDARFNNPKHFIAGNRGVTEWVFTGTGPNGFIEAEGCDVFTFRDGKIAVKNSFRKQRVG